MTDWVKCTKNLQVRFVGCCVSHGIEAVFFFNSENVAFDDETLAQLLEVVGTVAAANEAQQKATAQNLRIAVEGETTVGRGASRTADKEGVELLVSVRVGKSITTGVSLGDKTWNGQRAKLRHWRSPRRKPRCWMMGPWNRWRRSCSTFWR